MVVIGEEIDLNEFGIVIFCKENFIKEFIDVDLEEFVEKIVEKIFGGKQFFYYNFFMYEWGIMMVRQ